MKNNIIKNLMPIIGIPVPPFLAEALGYDGGGRYLVFFWHKNNNSLFWKDGVQGLIGGNTEAYLLFVNHLRIKPYLQKYRLGSKDVIAEDALVLDRQRNKLYVGNRDDIDDFIDHLYELDLLPDNPAGDLGLRLITVSALKYKVNPPPDTNEMNFDGFTTEEIISSYSEGSPSHVLSDEEKKKVLSEYKQKNVRLNNWLDSTLP
jgi:hypothetical protein